jgi:hypothetical protein
MRRRGYALSELLVALAVTGLIVSVLTFLNVDYVGLARRVADIAQPFEAGRRAEADFNADRCTTPAGLLAAGDNEVVAQTPLASTPVLSVSAMEEARGNAGGPAARPLRLVVESTAPSRRSLAAVEIGGATVGVVAPRCDLREVCDLDAANAMCREDEERPVAAAG